MSAALALSWAHVLHQFAEARARVSRELVAGMAQIVKVNARQADSSKRGHPGTPVEVAMTHRRAVRASEDERVGRAGRVKVLAEVTGEEFGERDDPPTGP